MDIEKTIDVAGKEIVEEDEDVEMDTTEDKAMEMAQIKINNVSIRFFQIK